MKYTALTAETDPYIGEEDALAAPRRQRHLALDATEPAADSDDCQERHHDAGDHLAVRIEYGGKRDDTDTAKDRRTRKKRYQATTRNRTCR